MPTEERKRENKTLKNRERPNSPETSQSTLILSEETLPLCTYTESSPAAWPQSVRVRKKGRRDGENRREGAKKARGREIEWMKERPLLVL